MSEHQEVESALLERARKAEKLAHEFSAELEAERAKSLALQFELDEVRSVLSTLQWETRHRFNPVNEALRFIAWVRR